jgi:hypothetical protein
MINRVEDYNSYIAGKDKNFSNDHYFISDLKYTDIIVKGNPPQIQDVDDAKCEIEYEAIVARNKRGIDGIDFRIHKIELELSVDDYPNDKKTFEFEIQPGINIDPGLVIPDILSFVVPTYPRQITIDMRKSMEVKDFKIVVEFGRDESYGA